MMLLVLSCSDRVRSWLGLAGLAIKGMELRYGKCKVPGFVEFQPCNELKVRISLPLQPPF